MVFRCLAEYFSDVWRQINLPFDIRFITASKQQQNRHSRISPNYADFIPRKYNPCYYFRLTTFLTPDQAPYIRFPLTFL